MPRFLRFLSAVPGWFIWIRLIDCIATPKDRQVGNLEDMVENIIYTILETLVWVWFFWGCVIDYVRQFRDLYVFLMNIYLCNNLIQPCKSAKLDTSHWTLIASSRGRTAYVKHQPLCEVESDHFVCLGVSWALGFNQPIPTKCKMEANTVLLVIPSIIKHPNISQVTS